MPVSTATKVASIIVANLTTDSMYCDHFIADLFTDSGCTDLFMTATSPVVGKGSSGATPVTNFTTAVATGTWTQVSKLANGSGDSSDGDQAGASSTSTGLAVVAGAGLGVPSGATVTGVRIRFMAGSESPSRSGNISATLINDSVGAIPLGGSLNTDIGYHYSQYSLGSSSNVWGAALTPAIVNASTFGVALTSTSEQVWSYNVTIEVSYTEPTVPTPGHWVQQGVMKFDGLTHGTTYYLKAGVVAPVSGETTWSGAYSIVAGSGGSGGSSINPTPACTYGVAYDVITTGISYTVTPASVPTDIDHFDYYYQFGSTTTPGSGIPARGSVPYSPDLMSTFHFSVACAAGAAVSVWVRAVSTSQATQAWTALTTKTSIAFSGTMDDVADGSTYARVKSTAISGGEVASIQSVPISSTPPSIGQTLAYNGTAWAPAAGGGGGGGGFPTLLGLRRTGWVMKGGGLATSPFDVMGETYTQVSGWTTSVAAVGASGQAFSSQQKSSSTDAMAGIYGSNGYWFLGTNLHMWASCYLGQTTNERFYVGLFDQSISNATLWATDTLTSNKYACFRYSTVAGDTAIQCITCDGSAQTVVSSGVSMDTKSHKYVILMDDTTPNVTFYIDGALVATITTHLPSGTTSMQYKMGVADEGAAADIFTTGVVVQSDI